MQSSIISSTSIRSSSRRIWTRFERVAGRVRDRLAADPRTGRDGVGPHQLATVSISFLSNPMSDRAFGSPTAAVAVRMFDNVWEATWPSASRSRGT